MDILAQLVVWLNAAANLLGTWLLVPLAVLPGWLSATLIAALTGVLLLLAFKYTSHQRAIKRVRDDIDANMLALKLFKDSARVAVKTQGRLLVGAVRLFVLALVPTAVMIVPVTLILGQLSLWYQQRPLRIDEEALVTLKLNGDENAEFPEVELQPTKAVDTLVGPVRVQSRREVCWNIKARANGYHRLSFQMEGRRFDKELALGVACGLLATRIPAERQSFDKELAIGDGFMRVSVQRPGWDWSEALLHPAEPPFRPEVPVRSIEIAYPERSSWTSGSDWWMVYWFAVSMLAAFCFRRVLKVNV